MGWQRVTLVSLQVLSTDACPYMLHVLDCDFNFVAESAEECEQNILNENNCECNNTSTNKKQSNKCKQLCNEAKYCKNTVMEKRTFSSFNNKNDIDGLLKTWGKSCIGIDKPKRGVNKTCPCHCEFIIRVSRISEDCE